MQLEALQPRNRNGVTITRHNAVVSLKRTETKQPTKPEKQPISWIYSSRCDGQPTPARDWAVRDRIPFRQVTLFSGEGAIGKSIVELMCSVAHVTGKDWLGSLPEPGGAFYVGCEDDEKE